MHVLILFLICWAVVYAHQKSKAERDRKKAKERVDLYLANLRLRKWFEENPRCARMLEELRKEADSATRLG